MHKLGGLRKGDRVIISREHLPGAVLFPAMKYKDIKPDNGDSQSTVSALPSSEGANDADAAAPVSGGDSGVGTEGAGSSSESSGADITNSTNGSADAGEEASNSKSAAASSDPTQPRQQLVHRFLVVTRERFIVLDSNGGGIGSEASVKSNHHLTEVCAVGYHAEEKLEMVCCYDSCENKLSLLSISSSSCHNI